MSTITTPSPQSIADPHATAAKAAIDKVLSVPKTTEQVSEQVSEEIEEVFATPPQAQEGKETPQAADDDDDVTVVKDDTPVNSEDDEDDASSSDDDDSDNSSLVEDLEQDVDDKTSENATLQAENKALKAENKALKAELDALNAALATARQQVNAKLTAKKPKKSKKKKEKKTMRAKLFEMCLKALQERIIANGMNFKQHIEKEHNKCQEDKTRVPAYRDILKANGFNLPPAKDAAPEPEAVLKLMSTHATKAMMEYVFDKYGQKHGSHTAKLVEAVEKANRGLPEDVQISMPTAFKASCAKSEKFFTLMQVNKSKQLKTYIVEKKEDILRYYVRMKDKTERALATKKRKSEESRSEADRSEADSSKKARTE